MGNNLDRSRLVSVIEQCLENEGNKFLNNCACFTTLVNSFLHHLDKWESIKTQTHKRQRIQLKAVPINVAIIKIANEKILYLH